MKKIFVRKVFSYDPTFGGKYARYKGYCQITLRTKNPDIRKDINTITPKNISKIFCSSLARGIQTATILGKDAGLKPKPTSDLNEVLFDLSALVSEKEFKKYRSNAVRKRFIEAFISDTLEENRNEIEYRVKLFISTVRKHKGNTLVVSHSFYMKILQTYLLYEELFTNPELIKKCFDPKVKTFESGEGFDSEL